MLSYYYVRPVKHTCLVFAMIDAHTRLFNTNITVKPVLSGHSKRRPKVGFQDRLLLNAGRKVLQNAPGEHSAILSTFIKLPFIFKPFVLPFFEWPLTTPESLIQFHRAD